MRMETGWVPVALSSTLEAGTSTGAIVVGREIVVWRDSSGEAHVWEDRCPHRGMRMSFGFVRGDHIACLYHGWQYDAAGQCRYIPAHPDLDVPKTIKVPTYLSEERHGIVWTTLSSDATCPEIPGVAEVTPVRSIYINAPLEQVFSALEQYGAEFSMTGRSTGILFTGGDRLLIAFQVVSAEKTALHIVILGTPSDNAGPKQKQYAQWAQTLRLRLESPVSVEAEVA